MKLWSTLNRTVVLTLATTVRLNIDSCYYSDVINVIRSTVGRSTTLVASLVPFTSRMVTGGQFPLLQNRPLPCHFKQCGMLTSVNSDEPVQAPFKLRN